MRDDCVRKGFQAVLSELVSKFIEESKKCVLESFNNKAEKIVKKPPSRYRMIKLYGLQKSYCSHVLVMS